MTGIKDGKAGSLLDARISEPSPVIAHSTIGDMCSMRLLHILVCNLL